MNESTMKKYCIYRSMNGLWRGRLSGEIKEGKESLIVPKSSVELFVKFSDHISQV